MVEARQSFSNVFDDWKYSPELHPNKFLFPLPPPVLPVGPLAVPPSPPSPSPPPPAVITSFPCLQCERVFFSARALSGHVSTGHKVLHPIQKYVGNTSVCQRCLLCFTSRPRLIHHLRQGSLKCSLFYSTFLPELSSDEVAASMKASRNLKCSLGHTRLTATVPVHRAHGPIWDPPVPPPAPP